MNVLAADDSPTLLDVLATTLREGGHSVRTVGNGRDAVSALKSANYDLIISDMNMVVMGGLEFLTHVRTDPQHTATPFVFLTTETETELKDMARAAGATAWMVKPFHPPSLLQLVERFSPF